MREKNLNELGLHIIRFTDSEIFNQIDNVVEKIRNYLESKDSP